jgi:hypothetical protein
MTGATRRTDGSIAAWTHEDGDIYIATGVDRNGRRLRAISSPSWAYIARANLWRGTYWCLDARTHKRVKLLSVN